MNAPKLAPTLLNPRTSYYPCTRFGGKVGGHVEGFHSQSRKHCGALSSTCSHVVSSAFGEMMAWNGRTCSHLAIRGAPARAIQELGGDQDLATTQRDMHLSLARSTRRFGCWTVHDPSKAVETSRGGGNRVRLAGPDVRLTCLRRVASRVERNRFRLEPGVVPV
jgi:hypothetical protein